MPQPESINKPIVMHVIKVADTDQRDRYDGQLLNMNSSLVTSARCSWQWMPDGHLMISSQSPQFQAQLVHVLGPLRGLNPNDYTVPPQLAPIDQDIYDDEGNITGNFKSFEITRYSELR